MFDVFKLAPQACLYKISGLIDQFVTGIQTQSPNLKVEHVLCHISIDARNETIEDFCKPMHGNGSAHCKDCHSGFLVFSAVVPAHVEICRKEVVQQSNTNYF